MGVAEQMLLNQVTIFNPPSISTTSSYGDSGKRSKTNYEYKPRADGRYAFGWNDPTNIYKEEK